MMHFLKAVLPRRFGFFLEANHFVSYKVFGDSGYFPYYCFITLALCKYNELQKCYTDTKLEQNRVHVAEVIYLFSRITFYISCINSLLLLARTTFC